MQEEYLFAGVTVRYAPQIVRIDTDHALMDFLAQRGNGSRALARHSLARYEALLGVPMAVAERSMATEILVHAYLDVVFRRAGRLGRRLGRTGRRLAGWGERMQSHTAVSDIGERAVDSNRHIFDGISHFYGVFRVLLGKWA